MKLNYLKELSPVLYGSGAVKILKLSEIEANRLCFSPHWHERMELLRVYSGELIATLGEETLVLSENQLAIIPPCRVHTGRSGENGVVYRTVMFDITSFYNDTPASARLLKPISELKVEFSLGTQNSEILAAVDSIIALYESERDNATPLVTMGKVYEILGLLYRHCLIRTEPVDPTDDRLKNVLDYINANFLDNITSSSLCRKFGYSQGYFCRRFKAVTGISPSAYIRILRLEEAKRSMRDTEESISNIASACGFSNISYFSRCFKDNYGMTPSEYISSERLKKNG